MFSPERRLQFLLEDLSGLLALGPGKLPLLGSLVAFQLIGELPHLLEFLLRDLRVLHLVLLQTLDGSGTQLRGITVVQTDGGKSSHAFQCPFIRLEEQKKNTMKSERGDHKDFYLQESRRSFITIQLPITPN